MAWAIASPICWCDRFAKSRVEKYDVEMWSYAHMY